MDSDAPGAVIGVSHSCAFVSVRVRVRKHADSWSLIFKVD